MFTRCFMFRCLVYLQAVVSLPLLPRQLVQFLELPDNSADVIAVDDSCLVDSDVDEDLSHRPVIGFTSELFSEEKVTGKKGGGECGSLPDVVVMSSVAAFYSSHE